MATVTPTFSQIGAKPSELPFDISQEQLKIARKQKMIDALAEQAMQYRGNTEMAGNVAIKKSPLEALAQTLTGGVLGYADSKLAEKSDALPGKLDELNKSELAKVRAIMAVDPKEGLQQALVSKSSLVRAWGEAEFKKQAEMQKMLGEKGAGAATGSSVVAAAQGGGVGALTPKAGEMQELGGIIFDKEQGKPITPLGPEGQFTPSYDARGNLMQTQPQTGKLDQVDKAPKVQVSSTANVAGPKAGAEALWKGVETDLADRRKALGQSQSLLGTLNDMEQLDKNGMYGGMTGPATQAIAKAGQAVGVPVDENTIANSTAYRSAQTKIWQNLVSQMGGNKGVTKEEAEEIKVILPRINDDTVGRQRIIQILRNSHARNVQQYGQMAGAAQRSYQHDDPTVYHQELGKLYTDDGSPQQATPMQNTGGGGGGGGKQPTAPQTPTAPIGNRSFNSVQEAEEHYRKIQADRAKRAAR
jgi:hypothetical protein